MGRIRRLGSACISNPPLASAICAASLKNLKGALTGGFGVRDMNGLVGLDGAEGITSVGVRGDGYSIQHRPVRQPHPGLKVFEGSTDWLYE